MQQPYNNISSTFGGRKTNFCRVKTDIISVAVITNQSPFPSRACCQRALPGVDHAALSDGDVRRRKDALVVLVSHGEAPVPAGILLQDLHQVSKPQGQVRVRSLGLIAIDHCSGWKHTYIHGE